MFNYDRETAQEKLEYEMFSEQCAEQAREEQLKCEPLWDGKKYINCKNCKIKEECECWYVLNKEFNIYSEDAEQ